MRTSAPKNSARSASWRMPRVSIDTLAPCAGLALRGSSSGELAALVGWLVADRAGDAGAELFALELGAHVGHLEHEIHRGLDGLHRDRAALHAGREHDAWHVAGLRELAPVADLDVV